MDLIPRQPFLLDHDSRTKPTRLECTFTLGHAEELSSNGKTTQEAQSIYTYGFKYTEKEICEEWLYQEAANEEQNNQLLFRRTTINKKIILQVDSQLSGENKVIERITRLNSLFLSAAAQNNHLQLLQIYRYFSTMISIEQPEFIEESSIADFLSKFGNQEEFKSILKQADIGITNVTVKEASLSKKELEIFRVLSEKIPRIMSEYTPFKAEIAPPESMATKRLRFTHSMSNGESKNLGYKLESRGTQVFLNLLLLALHALSKGLVLVIDELDTSLHPDLSRSLLSLFHKKASNPHGAQFLFSTHDVTLLDSDVLQQDEIWFTDKDPDGASRLTPLTDFKLPPPGELRHGDIEQAYRLGRFGGVPGSREFLVELDADQGEENE